MTALASLAAAVLAAAPLVPPLAPPPASPARPVTDTYQGVKVRDPYQWLEQSDDPAVQAWTKAQDARTRAHLGAVPNRAEAEARVREVLLAAAGQYSGVQRRGDTWFALKYQPPRQQPFLVTLGSPNDLGLEKVLVDPVELDPTGSTTLDFFSPSPDGALVAVSLSQKGTESGEVHVYEVETGKERGDRIPRVNGGTAGGGVAWAAGNEGFWYTRYPAPGERPEPDLAFFQEVWFHGLGAPAESDRYEVGREFDDPRIAEHYLQASEDGRRVLDLVQKGDGRDYVLYVRQAGGGWRKVAGVGDGVISARIGLDDGLWLLSVKADPRGQVLRVPWDEPELARAQVVAGVTEGAIESFEVTTARLYVEEIAGGPSTVRVLDLAGKPLGTLPAEPVTAVAALRRTGPAQVVVATVSYVRPLTWTLLDEASAVPRHLAISSPSPVDYSDVEVIRAFATSKDGTKVPLTILRRKGTPQDGSAPALLTGYGGYGISVSPAYSTVRRPLLDQGFVLAIANIRGGGEYGEAWHREGSLTHKQNVFDDFAACAQLLVDEKYTRSQRLALIGGSNGGLLMGAMITQHPKLARAVVGQVGIFDMLRVELTPNGSFNVTEFGTVKDPDQFKALYGYSPYHHVKKGTAYPAVLLTAGANDPRVDAWHAKKMTAALQAASGSKLPVLLRVSGFGHGMGTPFDERVAELTDVYVFLYNQLGLSAKPPPR